MNVTVKHTMDQILAIVAHAYKTKPGSIEVEYADDGPSIVINVPLKDVNRVAKQIAEVLPS